MDLSAFIRVHQRPDWIFSQLLRAGIDNMKHDALAGKTKMPLNSTRRNAKLNAAKREHDAKNNARITRNNAGVCWSRAESAAAYALQLKELLLDIGSGARFLVLALVNSYWRPLRAVRACRLRPDHCHLPTRSLLSHFRVVHLYTAAIGIPHAISGKLSGLPEPADSSRLNLRPSDIEGVAAVTPTRRGHWTHNR
jgi:hypothetical protein